MSIDKEFIGKTIQALRKNANIKQSELAEAIGISEKHLSKIETGKNYPSLNNFLKMAEVLQFSLDAFGIKNISKADSEKQALLKIAYSSTSEEAKNYVQIIETLNAILKNKN